LTDDRIAPAPSASPDVRGPWWRPRRATIVCGWLLFAALMLINLCGHTVVEVDIATRANRTTNSGFLEQSITAQAGWPLAYLSLSCDRFWPLAHLDEGVRWVSVGAIVANTVVAALLAAIGAVLVAQRFRSRRGWSQFGLFDLVALMTIAAAVLGWWYLPAQRNRQERAICSEFEPVPHRTFPYPSDSPNKIFYQPGRADWIRSLVGEELLPDTSYIVGVDCRGRDCRHVVGFSRLRVARFHGSVTDEELNLLAQLPELVALDLAEVAIRKDRGRWIDPPSVKHEYNLRLPQLKRLKASENVLQGSDLANLVGLEELYLDGCLLDDASLLVISRLPKLRVLDLSNTRLDDAGLLLLVSLERLDQVSVYRTSVTQQGRERFSSLRPNCEILQ
jgi:hypothetical protein